MWELSGVGSDVQARAGILGRSWSVALQCGILALAVNACGAGVDESGPSEGLAQSQEALVSPASAVWTAQGPAPMLNGQALTWPTTAKNPVAGAIRAVATHPSNANIAYAGTVNGGVWKTSNALAQSPTWAPLTDQKESLSIGAISLDRTNANTVVAATGLWSSYALAASPTVPNVGVSQGQILISRDSGSTWTVSANSLFANQKASSVIVRGNVVVAGFLDSVGLVRSTDLGAHWTRISASGTGLPAGRVDDLIEDIQQTNRLYLTSSGVGVFRSDDLGAHWLNVSQNDRSVGGLNDGILGSTAAKVRVAQDGRAYVGIVPPANHSGYAFVSYVGFTTDGGAHWTTMDQPFLLAWGAPFFHFSFSVDRSNSSFVYIGGEQDPMRGNAGVPAGNGQQWVSLVTTTSHGTWPHVDARNSAIDANQDLILVSDGGIFRRSTPSQNTGDWLSMAGNMQNAEISSIAYDPVSRVILAGTQDNGTVYQNGPNQLGWNTFLPDDGGDVQVDTTTRPGFSVRYSSGQFLTYFTRSTWNSSNVLQSQATPALDTGDPANPFQAQFSTPIAVNAVNGNRVALGAKDALYESFNQGDNVGSLGSAGNATAIVYGHTTNADVIYAAAGGQIFMKPLSRAPLFSTSPIPNCNAKDVVMSASDWQIAYALCDSTIYVTSNSGDTWTSITGNLSSIVPNPGVLRKVRFISGASRSYVAVAADRGVYVTPSSAPGSWTKVGNNLPIAPALAMQYSRAQDVLVVGTLGRGAWTVTGIGGP